MPPLTARCSGERDKSGPLAFGHANILRAITVDDDPTRDNLAMVFPVPDLPPEQVVGMVEALLVRHESLRTSYRLGPEPTQHVAGDCELEIDVIEAAEREPLEVAERTAKALRSKEFDLEAAPPLRVAFVTCDGLVRHLVWVVSHMAMDVAACEILLTEWTALTRGEEPGPAGPQPLDVVEFERKPFVRRLTDASVRYWERAMRSAPQAMFTPPETDRKAKTDWNHPGLRIRSRVAMDHLAAIAARTGANTSTILLAAVKALVAYRTGHRTCVTTALAGNRIFGDLTDLFGTISQDALFHVPLPDTFDELVDDVRTASLSAYRAGWYDPAALWAAISDVSADRGVAYARDVVFNDMSPLPGKEKSARSRLPWVWVPGGDEFTVTDPDLQASLELLEPENVPIPFIVYVYRLDEELDAVILADPLALPHQDLTEFGRALLSFLAAAKDHDRPLKEIATLTTLQPVQRGEGWYVTDSCWVELDAVRALTAEALPNHPHVVTAEPDDTLGHKLVCRVQAPADPRELHRKCLELLPGRTTAVAPHEYVVCAGPPEDPNSPETHRATGRTDR